MTLLSGPSTVSVRSRHTPSILSGISFGTRIFFDRVQLVKLSLDAVGGWRLRQMEFDVWEEHSPNGSWRAVPARKFGGRTLFELSEGWQWEVQSQAPLPVRPLKDDSLTSPRWELTAGGIARRAVSAAPAISADEILPSVLLTLKN